MMATQEKPPSRIDCHGHVWSDDPSVYPYEGGRVPPSPTHELGTAEVLLQGMAEANVQGFVIVQPIFHKFDDRYVTDTLAKHGKIFKGMLLIDPALSPEAAVVEMKRLHDVGYIGVRLNSGLWKTEGSGSFLDATGRAVMAIAGELNMVVGILCSQFGEQAAEIETLAGEYPGTQIVLDHFAGLNGEADPAWDRLIALARYPNLYVKVSGCAPADPPCHSSCAANRLTPCVRSWFRGGVDQYGPATLALLKAYGAQRLMFGTDFPWVMGDGQAGYAAQWRIFDAWASANLTPAERDQIGGGTAATLFQFTGTGAPPKL